MKEIIIGRLGNQPFQITDDTVSRRHAKLYYDVSSRVMIIENISETSGTYIRQKGGPFIQVMPRCNIDPSTEIRLGSRYVVRASELIKGGSTPPPPPEKSDSRKAERVDIAFLRRVAEHYESEKLRLDQQNSVFNNLKSLFMILSMGSGVIGAAITAFVGEEARMLSISITILVFLIVVAIWVYTLQASRSIIPKKNKNEKDYKVKYCCPKCHTSLAGRLYENILAAGKCPNCKVEYYDSKI